MLRSSLLVALTAVVALPAHAQTRRPRTPAGGPATRPAAPAPKDPAKEAAAVTQTLTDADQGFAKLTASGTVRDAMLATFADDAILFEPRAVRARPWIASSTPPAGQLTWAPAWVATTAAGELGVTTGPIAFHRTAPDSTANGHYVTLWTRGGTAGTSWKALAHLRVPSPVVTNVSFATHQPAGDGRPRGGPGAAEGVRATLFIADRGVAAAANADGIATALSRIALPDTRVLRDGSLPFVGADAIRQGLAEREEQRGGRLRWQTDDLRTSRSGDMGWSYGIYERRNATDAIVEAGNWIRVWERQPDGGWRILLDASAPLGR